MPLPLCSTILLAAASIALLSGRWTHVRVQWICGVFFFVAVFASIAVLSLSSIPSDDVADGKNYHTAFKYDGLAFCETWLALAFGLFAGVALSDSLRCEQETPSAYGFLLCLLAGLSLVAASNDFLSIGLSFEVLSLSARAFGRSVASRPRTDAARETSITGFDATQKMEIQFDWFASAWMWLGIAILTSLTATTQFDALRHVLAQNYNPSADQTPIGSPSKLVLLAIGSIAVSLFTRMGLAPMHLDLCSHRDGLSGLVFLARQLGGSIALTRLFGCVFAGLGPQFNVLATTVVLATFVLSAGMAMRGFSPGVRSIRRWITSLALLQSGWLAIGSMVAATELDDTGVRWGAFKHQSETLAIVVYGQLTNLLAFTSVFAILAQLRRVDREIEFFEDMKGLGRRLPKSGVALLVGFASIVSCPCTAGFWAKWILLLAGHNVHAKSRSAIFVPHEGLRLVMIAGIIATMLGAAVVIRIAREMFLESPLARPAAVGGRGALVSGMIAAAASLLLGICPELAFIPLRAIQHPQANVPADQERGSGKNSLGSIREGNVPQTIQ